MYWDWLFFWRAKPLPVIHHVPVQPMICPSCQQEVTLLRSFADGARLCLSCLEKR